VSRDSILAVGTVAHLESTRTQYEGLVDEVRVYDRALSGAEVRELYDMKD